MKEIILKEFQKKCILDLLDATSTNKSNEILIKSPTGSGKTIIMVNFINQYLENIDDKAIFIWFTPGIGDLEEQSKSKMEQYIPNRNTKTIKEVLQNGFDAGDTCFINWEVVTKKGNNAISKTEKNNLFERIDEVNVLPSSNETVLGYITAPLIRTVLLYSGISITSPSRNTISALEPGLSIALSRSIPT